jgi:hypothetical protein
MEMEPQEPLIQAVAAEVGAVVRLLQMALQAVPVLLF